MRGMGNLYRRGPVWWLTYSAHGIQRRESSGSTDENAAKRLLRKRIAQVETGKLPSPRADRVTLGDLRAMVLADYQANERRSGDRVAYGFSHLTEFFGVDSRVVSLTMDRVTAYQAHRRGEGAANSSVNYEVAMLRRGLRLAVRSGKLSTRPEITMLAGRG